MTKERDTFRKAIVLSSLERVYLVLKAFMCDNYRYVYIEIYIYINHFVQIFEVTCARESCEENAINFNNYTYHDGNVFISDTKCLIHLAWKVSNQKVIEAIYDTRL